MEISWYQSLKMHLVDLVGLSKDAIHIYIGFFCLMVSVCLLRRSVRSMQALWLGCAASVFMEALDLTDTFRAGRSLLWVASIHDLVNTNLLPLVLVLIARRGHFAS